MNKKQNKKNKNKKKKKKRQKNDWKTIIQFCSVLLSKTVRTSNIGQAIPSYQKFF